MGSRRRLALGAAGRLIVGQILLGLGVGLLLLCELGSDGYSTAVHGLSSTLHAPYVLVNVLLAGALILAAWIRGVRPGVGTLTQPFVVGSVASLMLAVLPEPALLLWSVAGFALSVILLAAGVALYMAADLGAGPVEAAAVAWSRHLGFRASYSLVQAIGAAAGWCLGAAVGPGTIAVAVAVGPLVSVLKRRVPMLGEVVRDGQ